MPIDVQSHKVKLHKKTMTTFAEQFKNEILRIAKKEIRVEVKQLKKASATYRSDIAALKRQVTSLESAIKKMTKLKPKEKAEVVSDQTVSLRFRASGFATLRKKFAMSAEQMGRLVGVTAQSVYHWEAGKSRPRSTQLPAIAAARKLSKAQAWEKINKKQ